MDGRFGEPLPAISVGCLSFGVGGRVSSVLLGLALAGELGSEFECGYSARGVDGTGQEDVGEPGGRFVDLFLRFSASSRTMLVIRSKGSSMFARFTVRSVSCSANLSQPWKDLKSTSIMSSCCKFLKANSGTAVSKGNSS